VIDAPQVTESADQLTAFIPLVVPRSEIQAVMGPAVGEVYAALAAQGVAPAGPWFTHHRRPPTDTFDFDVGVPVASPVAAAGRVRPGRLPAARVARTVYRGPYEGLSAAWGEFCAWIEANGHTPRADLWECYLVGPESGSDPAAWRTELNRPLAGS
jgi:effector-binding domain-containing protein